MKETINYYNQNADVFIEGTINVNMTEIQSRFLSNVPEKSKILDLGCGSGRDSKLFSSLGHCVTAVDGSPELCEKAAAYTSLPVRCLLFEDLDYNSEFDAVWACASLLHVEKEKMQHVLKLVSNALKGNGILYVSYKYGSEQRVHHGRLFSDYTEEDIPKLFPDDSSLSCIDYWITSDARADRSSEKWLNMICKKIVK